ncbi:MAG TPA: hypothetical protein VGI92_05615 [Gemmatimonadales bacterium]|jgi:hypothetical protein
MVAVTFSHRHLVISALFLTVACGGRRANLQPSPATPDQTVERFLAAVNASDVDGMAMLWGTRDGPEGVTHTMNETVRLQRLTIMQHMLKSDNHSITGTDITDPSKRVLTVSMTQNNRRFSIPFTLVPSRGGGWLINAIGLDAAMPDAGARP